MLLALLTSGGVYWLALEINWVLALLVNVIFLYLTLGFRQFSHAYTEIQLALENGDLPLARKILGEWMRDVDPGFIADRLTPGEVARHAIERALMLSHRHVFGVFFWFVLLPGPTGAVMYRVAQVAARAWRRQSPDSPFADFAQRAYTLVDWLPTRFTAVGFAIVGNFEDAMYGWRHEAGRWQDPSEGVVLAAGAGAMGIRLGGGIDNPLPTQQVVMAESGLEMEASVEPGSGMEVEPGHLRSAVGLVWRAMVLWLILLLMLSVTSWVT
jgi:adenosylcobinamide-phosphate synthase